MFKDAIATVEKLSAAAKLKNLFIGISLVLAAFTLGRIFWQFHLFDFNIYYVATQDAVAGRPLYHNALIDNNYPPSALLFILPFTLATHDVAEKNLDRSFYRFVARFNYSFIEINQSLLTVKLLSGFFSSHVDFPH
jgi:hypothetical protein